MPHDTTVILVGGPDAGKTNYLCRFWIALGQETGVLKKNGLPDDLAYLERGATALLQGGFAGRTPRGLSEISSIPFRCEVGDEDVTGQLVIPDCDGEQWMNVYRNREWPSEWDERITPHTGIILFVRVDSDHVISPLDWISCRELLGVTPEQSSPDTPNGIPTQVLLTDWLECLHEASMDLVGSRRIPVAVVVAAWDLIPVDNQQGDPTKYLDDNFPLFGQYLASNTDRFAVATFGVSIAGGDFVLEPDFKKQYCAGDPRSAGYVVYAVNGEVRRRTDITLPVLWATGRFGCLD